MLSLEEAIQHCEEVAEKQEITAKSNLMEIDKIKADGILRLYDADEYESCMKCAEEHRQLAEWLRELRELRRNRIGRFSVGCATCIHMKTDDYTKRPCDICCYNYFSKYESEVNANGRTC